jgi:two-component system nitrate/nitrite response regulator NarL
LWFFADGFIRKKPLAGQTTCQHLPTTKSGVYSEPGKNGQHLHFFNRKSDLIGANMKSNIINISILEDHQGIIDGYNLRLQDEKLFCIQETARFGNELDPMLETHPTDLLILDLDVPISQSNLNTFPTIQSIPKLTKKYPRLKILVISMHSQIVLVEKLIDLGISGYIFKSDADAIQNLAKIVLSIHRGETYFSQGVFTQLLSLKNRSAAAQLSPRQLEVLALCEEYPDSDSDELAKRLGISSSTFRNTLSSTYRRLGVHTRTAAVAYLQKLGWGQAATAGQTDDQGRFAKQIVTRTGYD